MKDEMPVTDKILIHPITVQTVGRWAIASTSIFLCGSRRPVAFCPIRDPLVMKEKDSRNTSSFQWITIWSCQSSVPPGNKGVFRNLLIQKNNNSKIHNDHRNLAGWSENWNTHAEFL